MRGAGSAVAGIEPCDANSPAAHAELVKHPVDGADKRPRRLAKIDVTDRTGPPRLRCNIREKPRLLRTADCQSRGASRKRSEAVEFGAAKLPCRCHFFAATAAAHRASVERHRILARADDEVTRGVRHRRRAHSAAPRDEAGRRSFASCSCSQRSWCSFAQLRSTSPVPMASNAPSMPSVPM